MNEQFVSLSVPLSCNKRCWRMYEHATSMYEHATSRFVGKTAPWSENSDLLEETWRNDFTDITQRHFRPDRADDCNSNVCVCVCGLKASCEDPYQALAIVINLSLNLHGFSTLGAWQPDLTKPVNLIWNFSLSLFWFDKRLCGRSKVMIDWLAGWFDPRQIVLVVSLLPLANHVL